MKNFTKECIFILFALFLGLSPAMGQVVFWSDDFNGAGPTSGDRDATAHVDGDNGTGPGTCGPGDYFFRTSSAVDAGNGLSITFSGFTGSYWRGEDLNGCVTNPDIVNFTGINISGLSDFRFNGSFGANPSNSWEGNEGDGIFVEYRIDGGAFQPGIFFNSTAATIGVLAEDTDQDGTGDGTTLGSALQSFSFTFGGSGTTLDLRVTVSADDGSEEFAFDNFFVEHSVVLPVELLSFEGKMQEGKAMLDWQTASELNNEGFEIQRSLDGKNWKVLDFVPGAGNGQAIRTYDYIDVAPGAGITYYRLRQVDLDGKYVFSNVVSVENKEERAKFGELFPNPSKTGIVYLDYTSKVRETINISVYDLMGRMVMQERRQMDRGQSVVELLLSDAGKGLYTVVFDDGTTQASRRIVLK
ncbi:MAG: T9SS type A sorting domain-containing protein [Bacteroidota bacterium]